MPPLYRMLEVCVYSLTNFLPFLAMALYPFRRRLRFSPAVAAAEDKHLKYLEIQKCQ